MSEFRDGPPVRPSIRRNLLGPAIGGVFLLLFLIGGVTWFVIRVEVNANEILVLVNKTGKVLPDELRNEFGDQVVLYPELVAAIAAKTGEETERIIEGYKGIQFPKIELHRAALTFSGG